MKTAMTAIIKKDFRGVTDNKHLFASLLIVPLVLTIVLPSVFLVMIHFAPDDPDIQRLLELLPQSMQTKSLEQGLAELVLNFMLPVFFLIIPIMSASIWRPVPLWVRRKSTRWRHSYIARFPSVGFSAQKSWPLSC